MWQDVVHKLGPACDYSSIQKFLYSSVTSECDKSRNFAGKMNGQITNEQLNQQLKHRIGLNGDGDETAARTLGTKRVGGIRHKMCELCSRQPTFNFQGFKAARFCSEHREAGMVNVVNKKCQSAGCMKVTLFFLK
jgi:hypothetical protein